MIEFRASTQDDAHYLLDIDLKCFDLAWTPDDWREASEKCFATVATSKKTPIAMAVFWRSPDNDIEILRLGVKPEFRRSGIARQLIRNCMTYARECNAFEIRMLLPESRLCPGEPDDLSVWLRKTGFRATLPLHKDAFTFYGRSEDGVAFVLPTSKG